MLAEQGLYCQRRPSVAEKVDSERVGSTSIDTRDGAKHGPEMGKEGNRNPVSLHTLAVVRDGVRLNDTAERTGRLLNFLSPACGVGKPGCDGRWKAVNPDGSHNRPESSPRLSQPDSCFIERGTLQLQRLRRTAVISVFQWGCGSEQKAPPKPAPAVPLDPLKLARHYQALLDTGRFENRAALARHLGVSRARVTRVLRRPI
jgi:hypothetical protein